jgi:hypothetical protein
VHGGLNGLIDSSGIRYRQFGAYGIVSGTLNGHRLAASLSQAAVNEMTVGNANCVGIEIVHVSAPLQGGLSKGGTQC